MADLLLCGETENNFLLQFTAETLTRLYKIGAFKASVVSSVLLTIFCGTFNIVKHGQNNFLVFKHLPTCVVYKIIISHSPATCTSYHNNADKTTTVCSILDSLYVEIRQQRGAVSFSKQHSNY
jgi:hypothetical protein